MLKITSESQTGRLEPSPQEGALMAIILQFASIPTLTNEQTFLDEVISLVF